MREMAELRRQITRILTQQDASLTALLAQPLTPPTASQSSLLRQVVSVSRCDA